MIWIAGHCLSKSGTKFEKNNYLIEDPLFVNSEYRHLSQLADCVAYCVKKRFRENEPEESQSCLRAATIDWRISSSNVIPKAKDMESKSTHTRICSGVEWPEGPQSLHKSYPIVARLIHGMFQTIKDLSRYKG